MTGDTLGTIAATLAGGAGGFAQGLSYNREMDLKNRELAVRAQIEDMKAQLHQEIEDAKINLGYYRQQNPSGDTVAKNKSAETVAAGNVAGREVVANIGANASEAVANMGAQSRETVAGIDAQSRERVAGTGARSRETVAKIAAAQSKYGQDLSYSLGTSRIGSAEKIAKDVSADRRYAADRRGKSISSRPWEALSFDRAAGGRAPAPAPVPVPAPAPAPVKPPAAKAPAPSAKPGGPPAATSAPTREQLKNQLVAAITAGDAAKTPAEVAVAQQQINLIRAQIAKLPR